MLDGVADKFHILILPENIKANYSVTNGGDAEGAKFVHSFSSIGNPPLPSRNYYTETGTTNNSSEGSEKSVGESSAIFESTVSGGDGGDGSVVITFYEFDPSVT